MEKSLLIFVVVLVGTSLLQGLVGEDEKFAVKRRLKLLNKPALKSFQTEFGDIFDCVEINKQLAFDHPLLKNHTIQMKPSMKMVSKLAASNEASHCSRIILPKMRCPRGTVPIKRIGEEELIAMEKFKPAMPMKFPTSGSSSKLTHPLDGPPPLTDLAMMIAMTTNYGVAGSINLWSPEVKDDQSFSSGNIAVASDYGSATNLIIAGWSVNPFLYQNFTRLTTYWSIDGGRNTGCFDVVCPGFVQTSRSIPLGLILHPISEYNGEQFYVDVSIEEDQLTENWWLNVQGTPVGYWPKELFTSLTKGATRAAWGGEVLGSPGMGSGHFPDERFKKAAFIRQMKLVVDSSTHSWVPPSADSLKLGLTKANCFRTTYNGNGDKVNRFMYPDAFPRLHTVWTTDNFKSTGCANTMCPRFVQTSQKTHLGVRIYPVSQYNGPQYEFNFRIYQDPSTHNWWLMHKDMALGYWPKELFGTLTQGATQVGWGGEVSSPLSEGNPGMGSGCFPIEGWKKAAYISKMEVIPDSPSQKWSDAPAPGSGQLMQILTNPLCFKISVDQSQDENWGHFMYFGGPPDCYDY